MPNEFPHPDPKFRKGQVVFSKEHNRLGRVEKQHFSAKDVRPDNCHDKWGYWLDSTGDGEDAIGEWICECQLRALNQREVGPGWRLV